MLRSERLAILLLLLAPAVADAEISAVPDIGVDLSGVAVTDDEVAVDDLMGGIAIDDLGGLPEGVEVDAYHALGGGEVLFSIDGTALLGGTRFDAEDVIRFDGGSYTVELDGSAVGVSAGTNLDALTLGTGGELVVSFDSNVVLDGTLFFDEDLTRWNGASFSMELDGSAEGFDPALDLDGVSHHSGAVYAFSFDGHGSHGGVTFADEDVIRYDPAGPTTVLLFDASAEHAGWAPADLAALPEPSVFPGMLLAGAMLAALRQRRPRGCA